MSESERGTNRSTVEEEGLREGIVAIGDGDVFHQVALVEDIGTNDGDFDVEEVCVCF
jgi:hypothetical protein